jgi:hypothetical protein
LLQRQYERRVAGFSVTIFCADTGCEHTNTPDVFALLRPRRERPRGGRAAEQREELASSYVGHGLPLGTRCASLPHAKVAPEGTGRSLG